MDWNKPETIPYGNKLLLSQRQRNSLQLVILTPKRRIIALIEWVYDIKTNNFFFLLRFAKLRKLLKSLNATFFMSHLCHIGICVNEVHKQQSWSQANCNCKKENLWNIYYFINICFAYRINNTTSLESKFLKTVNHLRYISSGIHNFQ